MKSIILRLAPLSLLLTGSAFAQGLVQAPLGPDGTWNLYLIDFGTKTFKAANEAAEAMVDPTGLTATTGHLVSIRSQRKNDFVWRLGDRGNIWIGLTDREGAAPGAQESQTQANNQTMGWAWTSGEGFTFQNWGGGEPNDFNNAEDAAHIRDDGLWNDNGSGYGADDPIAPTLQPGTSNAEAAPVFKSAIEFEINSPNPIPGVRKGNIFADMGSPTPLPGPAANPTQGVWQVREIQGITGIGNVYDAVSAARSGNGNIIEGTRPVLDVTDPNTNTNTGSVPGGESAFFHDTGADDNDLISINHGTINVTEGGDYTFQVRSDDGFALRINGQTPTNVYGPAQAGIDPLDPTTVFFRNGTGDANTRAAYNLAPGQYDVELITWEGGGGAYYEFSSSKGNISAADGANWILVGDAGTAHDVQVIADPAVLAGDATWYKVDQTPPATPGALASIITTLDNAVANNNPTSTGTRANLLIGEGDIPGTDDNYMLRVDASFTVDNNNGVSGEAIAMTFRLSNDDGGAIHILGQDFTGVAGGANSDGALWNFGDDVGIGNDVYTGDTNLYGHITLTEGVDYDLTTYMFEGGGGSRLQVQAALGTLSALADGTFFTIDGTNNTIIRPANQGIALVPEPSSSLLALAGGFLLCGRRRSRR